MFDCTITSAEYTEKHNDLQSLIVPAHSGRLQILSGHAESFILLMSGELVLESSQGRKIVSIGGGACHVGNDEVKIIL